MSRYLASTAVLFLIMSFILPVGCEIPDSSPVSGGDITNNTPITLPEPHFTSDVSLEEALLDRRSVREYTGEPVTLQELSQLLWAAQGITNEFGHRTAPSAGGTYPLEVYVVAGNVEDLPAGIYHYLPDGHRIELLSEGDQREVLMEVTLDQEWVAEGALNIVITGVYERVTGRYGDRGVQYTYIELGHAAQNICLQAVALGLGTVTIGAFDEAGVGDLLGLPDGETPLYVMPVGKR